MSGELSQSSLALMLLLSVALGFVGALVYDVFRIRRRAIKIPILPHFEDFLFMLAFGAVMTVILYIQNSGRLRWFNFAGALGGLYLYRKTLGRPIMAAADKIISFVRFLVRKFVLPPIRAVKNTVKRAASKVYTTVWLCIRRKSTKRYVRAFTESALCAFGDGSVKIKENKRKRKNK